MAATLLARDGDGAARLAKVDATDERNALWNALRKDSSVYGKSVKVI